MRLALRPFGIQLVLLASLAGPASATLVGAHFEGTTDSRPGGAGAPFSGTLLYDPSQPPNIVGGSFAGYLYSEGASLRVEVLEQVFAVSAEAAILFSVTVGSTDCMDSVTGETRPCKRDDPFLQGASGLAGSWIGNTGQIEISVAGMLEEDPSGSLPVPDLPHSSEVVAALLQGGSLHLLTREGTLTGTIERAVAIPEPGTALLLGLGLLVLSTRPPSHTHPRHT